MFGVEGVKALLCCNGFEELDSILHAVPIVFCVFILICSSNGGEEKHKRRGGEKREKRGLDTYAEPRGTSGCRRVSSGRRPPEHQPSYRCRNGG